MNTYYALGTDFSPEDPSSFNIPGYNLPSMLGFIAVVVMFLIHYRGKSKKQLWRNIT